MTKERQQEIFQQGKAIRQEDRNFLSGPRQDSSANAFLQDRLATEHRSAAGFIRKGSLDHYLNIDPTAKDFIPKGY